MKEMDLFFVLFKAMGFYTKPILLLICFSSITVHCSFVCERMKSVTLKWVMPFIQTQSLSYGNKFVLNCLHSPDMHTIASKTVYRNFFCKKKTNKQTKKIAILRRILSTEKRRFEIPRMNALERNDISVDV